AGTTIQKMAIPPSIDLTLAQVKELISDPLVMLLLAGIGITFLSTCLVAISFRFGRSNILFSMMGGTCSAGLVLLPFLFLGESITAPTFVGMLLIVAGVAFMGVKFPSKTGKQKQECKGSAVPRK
ncbi:MAG: hypothetical protein PHH26_07925, partial [Candidatus Thermoplasmatota archaeon]|nr:hypothetical protein [Candidatus Thermoplasmatota archaeon]